MVIASPTIGIKVKYLTLVLDTIPVAGKREPRANTAKQVASVSREYPPGTWYNLDAPTLWLPGTPSYAETFDIIQEIFNRPYATLLKVSDDTV
jgi:hypothetical protein